MPQIGVHVSEKAMGPYRFVRSSLYSARSGVVNVEAYDEGVCWIDGTYFAEGMVVVGCWVESSSCVQDNELRHEDVVG